MSQEELQKINDEYHFFTTLADVPAVKEGKLSGYSISIKDAILLKDVETTASSTILKNYKPLFNATVVEKMLNEGGNISAKAVHDEFGFGVFSVNLHGIPVPLNPLDKERTCGGSSGGCAGAVAKLDNHISLGESTGGSIVCPAAFCGVVGLCPTYGRISRYGLIDYGNSLDKIGPITKTVADTAKLLSVIAGNDPHDSTSATVAVDDYESFVGKDVTGMKVGVIKEGFGEGVDPKVAAEVKKSIEVLKSKGVTVEEVSLPLVSKYSLAVYYIQGTSEVSTNLSKLCGMRYGQMSEPSGKSFNDYFTGVRSNEFTEEAKRRIMLGTFARMAGTRDAYYIKAAQVRTMIIEEYKKLFETYDALLSPAMPCIAPRFDEIEKMTPLQHYMMDILLVGPNVAGLPHMTVPTGTVDTMPVGTMLIGDHFKEGKIIQLSSALEKSE